MFRLLRLQIAVQLFFVGVMSLTGRIAWAGPDLSPVWLDQYRVRAGLSDPSSLNTSVLSDYHRLSTAKEDMAAQIYDNHRALEWQQAYDDINRDYEMRQRAGIANLDLERNHMGQVSNFGHGILDEIQNRKLSETGMKVEAVIKKDRIAMSIAEPAAVVAGVYIGKPMRLRIWEDTRVQFRTDFRGKTGGIELHSPLVFGSLEFRPLVPETRDLNSPTNVDFGDALNMNRAVDFSQERYQVTLARALPIFDLTSSVLYGSSSNAVAGSISKRLSNHLTAVVDSIHSLNSYDYIHPSSEDRLRLRYDIRF